MQERAKMPDDRLAQTSVPIHDLMARRWSPRAYDASKPVSREQLRTLPRIRQCASSGFQVSGSRVLLSITTTS